MDSVWTQIGAIAEENSGIITTAMLMKSSLSGSVKDCMYWKKGWWMNTHCCRPGAEKSCILMGQRFFCGACLTECRTHLI